MYKDFISFYQISSAFNGSMLTEEKVYVTCVINVSNGIFETFSC